MKRRHLITMVVVAMLLPQVAGALPRPSGGTQSGAETIVFNQIISASLAEKSTPILTSNAQYKVEVSGTWKPSSAANHNADAAFEATTGSNWAKTGKGLYLGTYQMGAPGNAPLTVNTSHSYSFTYTGRGVAETVRIVDQTGNTDGNSGGLTVVVKSISQVRWLYPTNVPIDFRVPGTPPISGDVDTRPYGQTQTVDNVEVNTTTTVASPIQARGEIAFVTGPECGTGLKESRLRITMGGSTVVDQFLLCLGSDATQFLGFLDGGKSLGAGTPQPITIGAMSQPCAVGQESCDVAVGGFYFPFSIWQGSAPMEIPGLPPGSRGELVFGWEANYSKLWPSFFNTQQGDQWVAPFNPFAFDDSLWFAGEVAAGRQSVILGLTLYGPNGQPVGGRTVSVLPGMGQILESAFATKVSGS